MRRMPKVWRILRVWSERRKGMRMIVKGTANHNGVWLRPFFGSHQETLYAWVHIETGAVLCHFSEIPKDAEVRPYGCPVPDSLKVD